MLVGVTEAEVPNAHVNIFGWSSHYLIQIEKHWETVHNQGGKNHKKKWQQFFEWRCRYVFRKEVTLDIEK